MRVLKLATMAMLFGCGSPHEGGQAKDLVFDKHATNIFLNIGAPTNLTGVPIDIQRNEAQFKAMNFGFEVVSQNRATRAQILDLTRQNAARVSDTGTLLWYFSGHGMDTGGMLTEDQQTLMFREIADAIKGARQKPLKRLLVVIDNCFSGTNIEAVIPGAGLREGITAERLSELTVGSASNALKSETYAAALYEQALVFTASTASQTSLDGGEGGVFSDSWRRTLEKLRSENPRATIRDMVTRATEQTTEASGGHHTPLHKALPAESVLGDLLFESQTRPDGGNPPQNPPANPPSNPGTTPVNPVNPGGPESPQNPANPPQPTSPTATGLTLLLSTPDRDGLVHIEGEAPADAQRMTLCKGTEVECRASLKEDFVFGKTPTKTDPTTGRKTFALIGLARLTAGQTYALLAFDAAGQLQLSKELKTSL